MNDTPSTCGYRSTECDGRSISTYEANLKSVTEWKGQCCLKCLIAMQRVVYRNNYGSVEFREHNSDVWRTYGSQTDPTHAGRNDHLA